MRRFNESDTYSLKLYLEYISLRIRIDILICIESSKFMLYKKTPWRQVYNMKHLRLILHSFIYVEISNNTEHVQYKNSNIRDEFFEINQVVSDGLVNCNTPFIVCNTKSEHQDICSK